MIQVEVFDDANETTVARLNMQHAPAVGDVLWLLPKRAKSTWRVTQVCHWVSDAPQLVETGYHHLAVYAEHIPPNPT